MTSFQTVVPRPAIYLILLFSLGLGACSTIETQSFLHTGHRGLYAFSQEDMGRMQFYTSREVLAHRINEDGQTTADDVIVIPIRTRGNVVEAGPNWLRVKFNEGGTGSIFLASGKGEDSLYKFATETEGGQLQRIEEMPEPILIHEGNRYKIIHGVNAFLLIGQKDLKEIVAERSHLSGAKKNK